MNNSFQCIVKSFERPNVLRRLLDSITKQYPDTVVWIADDSIEHPGVTNQNHHVLKCPFDIGQHAGRQIALGCVTTPWFVLLDDDYVLREETKFEKLVEVATQHNLDIIGGGVCDAGGDKPRVYHGFFNTQNHNLTVSPVNLSGPEPIISDLLTNFYVARTDRFRSIGGWDCRIKVGGHVELFLRAKKHGLRVGCCPSVKILHDIPDITPEYSAYRHRNDQFWPRIAYFEYGLRKLFDEEIKIV